MEKEIKHISGSAGGFLVGRSHANNGIKAINKSTGLPLEMEGGEVVITKTAVEDDELREFEGEMLTNRQILSKINESGGGVSFALGGDIPTELYFTGNSYKYGGDTLTDYQIAHKISSCGCKHQKDGLSEGKTLEDIAEMHNVSISHIENQIENGIQVEAEHTSNPQEQVKIAMDHLVENPNYYDILAEANLEKGGNLSNKKFEKKFNKIVIIDELKSEIIVIKQPDGFILFEINFYKQNQNKEPYYIGSFDNNWDRNETSTVVFGKFMYSGNGSSLVKISHDNFEKFIIQFKKFFDWRFSNLEKMNFTSLKNQFIKAAVIFETERLKYEKGGNLKKGAENDDLDNVAQVSDEVLDGPDIIASEGGYFEKGGFLPTDIPQKLRSDISFLVDLQDKKQNNRPSDGWDINLFKSSFFNKVKKLPNDQAIVVLDFLTALEETVGVKPIFSKNHKIWENYSTQKEVSNNSEFQVGDKIKYKNSSEVGEVIEVVPSQFEDIISIKYPNGEILKDGVTNLEKPKNTESEFEEIGGNFSFKNKFGSFTSVKVMPVDASLKPSKEFFSLAITVRKTTSDGKNIIQNKPLITMPVSQYKEYMTDLKTKVNQGSENFKKDIDETINVKKANWRDFINYKRLREISDNLKSKNLKELRELLIDQKTKFDRKTSMRQTDLSLRDYIWDIQELINAHEKAENQTSKYQVGDFVKYETGDLESERWVGEIKEVKNYGNEIAYKIDAYTRGVEAAPMFDAANNNEVYEAQLKPTNDLVFNEAKKHYNRVMEKKQAEQNKKYDLGASFAGGVTVVWDRNQTKKGDYKTIAHIPSIGSVKYFEENLPQYVIDYVEGMKSTNKAKEPQTQTNYQISNYRNPYEVNRAIEQLIDSKESGFTPNEIEFISNYSGYGGLEKQGSFSDEELKGLLYEYFTPDAIVKKMWALAYKYGFGTIENPHVMEPSVGTGNFFKYAPINAELFGNEINRFSKKVCEILYPKAMITLQPFEKNFISKNNSIKNKLSDIHKYHLVIGNPPYGRADSKFLAMGEKDYTKASNFTEYFITRGLDLLHPGGLLIFVVGAEQYNGGTLFLDSGISTVKKNIFDKAQLVDAYRLPTKIFERTGVASEILVFKKK